MICVSWLHQFKSVMNIDINKTTVYMQQCVELGCSEAQTSNPCKTSINCRRKYLNTCNAMFCTSLK